MIVFFTLPFKKKQKQRQKNKSDINVIPKRKKKKINKMTLFQTHSPPWSKIRR